MNSIRLTMAYLRARWLNTALNVMLLALGVAAMTAIVLFTHTLENRLSRDAESIDLVVGAKGSPLQLILSSIYHVDIPTGNIPLEEANKLRHHPLVGASIPLALGDSVHSYRIVGTEPGYAEHYHAQLAQGAMFAKPFEATLGAEAARALKLKVGDTFVGSHGLTEGGEIHAHAPYTVAGILQPTHSVLDRLILTPVESVWLVHAHHDDDDDDNDGYSPKKPKEITALLISYSTPAAVGILPRIVNSQSSLQAASPAFETVRVLGLLGVGIDTLRGFAYLLVGASALGIFISLMGAMQERRYDIAVIRALGASRRQVMLQLLVEGLMMAFFGAALGIIFGHAACQYFGAVIPQARGLGLSGFMWLPQENWVIALTALIGAIAALIPAIGAYRIPISKVLAEGK